MRIENLTCGCTIVSPNYLPYARTLANSFLRHHPGARFCVLIVARNFDKVILQKEPFTPVTLDELGIPDLPHVAMKYDILELNTNVKPSFLKHLFRATEADQVIYLDPDIYIYQKLDPILNLLEASSVVLTPHITSPINDSNFSGEREFLSTGTYNLGFIALRQSSIASQVLDWWESRCLKEGFNETRAGLFVDQKWVNLVPALFEGVALCKDVGCNMAYWNLHERLLENRDSRYYVNGKSSLKFFHFSGVDLDDSEQLSKYTKAFSLDSRPDLRSLFVDYRVEVVSNRDASIDRIPYGFDRFSNGEKISQLVRRLYAASTFNDADPFQDSGDFYAFVKSAKLLVSDTSEVKSSWKDFNPRDKRVLLAHRLLRAAMYVLGPAKYELLMKYLGHISVLREQVAIFKP